MNEPIFAFNLDAPLSLHYDAATGEVLISAAAPTSDRQQATAGVRLTAAAATALLAGLQRLETHEERPPSAHTTPRTRQ